MAKKKVKVVKEYRNVIKDKNGWRSPTYNAELWLDGEFSMNVYLSEVNYLEAMLQMKLEIMIDEGIIDKALYDEIEKVMELKYNEGMLDEVDANAGPEL